MKVTNHVRCIEFPSLAGTRNSTGPIAAGNEALCSSRPSRLDTASPPIYSEVENRGTHGYP
jgi:hypothetical protein